MACNLLPLLLFLVLSFRELFVYLHTQEAFCAATMELETKAGVRKATQAKAASWLFDALQGEDEETVGNQHGVFQEQEEQPKRRQIPKDPEQL